MTSITLDLDMKTTRIVHREYFIDLERNAYSWQIVAITHRSAIFHPAPSFFILTETLRSNAGRLLSRASSRLVVPKDEKSEGIEFVSSIAGTKLNNVVIVFYNALH
jgi:hypothetical protein